ncbi:hypothetical protein YPPY01_2622, partial [Yersinia pestis PY-01]
MACISCNGSQSKITRLASQSAQISAHINCKSKTPLARIYPAQFAIH